MIRIACVACLDPTISIHTPEFLRAVKLAQNHALGTDVELKLYNDKASAAGATAVVDNIIADAPDIIVGHFASSAAQIAAPKYVKAGLRLILPAATHSDLTLQTGVYRVCDNDSDYVRWLCSKLGQPIEAAISDGSAHGDSVADFVRKDPTFEARLTPKTVLISGLYRPTITLAARANAQTIVLTDDACAPTLANDLQRAGVNLSETRVFVGALRPKAKGHVAKQILAADCKSPGTYFWETIASLQIAQAKAQGQCRNFETVLGAINFDRRGEARPNAFQLLDLKNSFESRAVY